MSLTISGLFAMAIVSILKATGHDIDTNILNTTLDTDLQILAAVVAYIGRYRHGDITWYGAKVNPAE